MIPEDDYEGLPRTKGSRSARIALRVTEFSGSWTFIILYVAGIVLWMGLNVLFLKGRAFDPYPFVFLNLVLAIGTVLLCAFVQMGQNQQAARDREEIARDQAINAAAAQDIRAMRSQILRETAEIKAMLARLGTGQSREP